MRKINNEKKLQEKPENRHQTKKIKAQRGGFKFISAVARQIKLEFVSREGIWRDVDEKQRIIKVKNAGCRARKFSAGTAKIGKQISAIRINLSKILPIRAVWRARLTFASCASSTR